MYGFGLLEYQLFYFKGTLYQYEENVRSSSTANLFYNTAIFYFQYRKLFSENHFENIALRNIYLSIIV